jgi:arylsulfatase
VNGVAQKPIEGVSMAYTFDKANANARSKRETQYFEMFGLRAIYHDGWIAATPPPAPVWMMGTVKLPEVVNGYDWELYNIAEDYSENNNLAAKNPDKLREMKELFLVEATKYNVFPLDNSILPRLVTPRPSATAGRTVFTYSGELAGLPVSDAPSLLNKSYTITADVEIPRVDTEGMIATMGGRFAGYGLYLLKGRPVFTYNAVDLVRFKWQGSEPLNAGKHTIVFEFTYDGPGFGKGGTGVLSVDGKTLDTKKIPHTIPFLMSIDESFDIGVDTRTSVDDKDYQVPFRFTGKIAKLTFKLGPEQVAEEEQKAMQQALARAKD